MENELKQDLRIEESTDEIPKTIKDEFFTLSELITNKNLDHNGDAKEKNKAMRMGEQIESFSEIISPASK
jgi:hypothetical protein